ncbi:hypothetical protein D9757_011204 [Collybiopsis confluens]|uniref:Uncharacterized protein n=1 Tax=Collybiopsis confluens TaxID=2823264 RepID=A0A8H5H3L9_9AGAR|nr:hypothetical protein D9757_011204 [Collybiopsis confluens]
MVGERRWNGVVGRAAGGRKTMRVIQSLESPLILCRPFEMNNARASSRECTIATAIDCMSPKLGLCHFPFLILKNLDFDFYPHSFRLQSTTFVSLVAFSSPDPPPSKPIDETRDRYSSRLTTVL